MIRYIEINPAGYGGRQYVEMAGLSTDNKPKDNLVTGSLFMEVDTGDVYAFDETGEGTWTKIGG